MERKQSSLNKDLWFVCDKCGTEYDEFLEEIMFKRMIFRRIPSEEIKGTIEWANTPTLDANKWDAITKSTIRGKHESKECESKGTESTKFSKG
tara:strand:+ start:1081 stop:1359 length:279 start_codon:yes stop_codon:yes gene_type:complete